MLNLEIDFVIKYSNKLIGLEVNGFNHFDKMSPYSFIQNDSVKLTIK